MSYPRYPAYKDSDVEWLGEVPEHWGVSPLFAMMNEREEKNTGNLEQNVLSLSYGRIIRRDVESNFGLLPESFETYQILYPGDIVLRLTDLQNDHRSLRVGAVQERGIITSAYVGLRPSSSIDSRFVFYLLNGYDLLKVFYGFGGGVRQSMNFKDLRRLPLLMPPLPEQRAIAAFLDGETARIDALVAKQEALIALLQEKRKAVISHAVTKGLNADAPMKDSGVAWLGAVPAGWDVQPLKRIARRIDVGIAAAAVHAYADSGVPILRSMNVRPNLIGGELIYITDDFAEQNKSKYLFAGDILTVRTGHAGVSAVVPAHLDRSHCFTMLMTTLSVSAIPEYICQYMNCAPAIAHFQSEGWGAAQPNISVPILQMLSVPVPPIKEQQQIVAYLDHETARIDALIAKAEQFIERLREHRTALIAAAVTGKIDVRTLTP